MTFFHSGTAAQTQKMRALSHETQHVIIMHAATAENKKSDNSLERQRPRQKTKRKKNERMYIYENCLILFLRYQRFKCSASFDFMPCIVRSIWIFRNFFFFRWFILLYVCLVWPDWLLFPLRSRPCTISRVTFTLYKLEMSVPEDP